MHKIIIAGMLLLLVQQLQGQIFYTEIVQSDLIATHFNDMDFSDVDGDGDLDVVIAGFREDGLYRADLYFNNGNGIFTRSLNTNFPPVFIPSIVFTDIDGDNDEDLFISGTGITDEGYIKLYTNDGNGIFTEFPSSIFLGLPVNGYDADFSDIDNDGDQDLCLIGGRFLASKHANLYFNDGTGVFSKDTMSDLHAVASGTVDFSDIDNDGDQDLLITGMSEDLVSSTKLYENDGTGKFDVLNSSNLEQLGLSTVAFTDIDGDSDQDFILSGRPNTSPSSPHVTLLYKNNGDGIFMETANNSINQLSFNSLSFGDVEGDGDNDLLISGGAQWTTDEITKLYLNDGTGEFTEYLNSDFEPIRQGTAVFEELNGDDKIDMIFSGRSSSSQALSIAKVYENQNISGIEPEISNSIIKSYSYINGILNVSLSGKYENIEINVYNVLGQILFSQHYLNIDHLQIELPSQVSMKFLMIKANNKEIGLIKLMN